MNDHQADEPRILTEAETARRLREQAAHIGPKTITPCAEPGCTRAASYGPLCWEHKQPAISIPVVARDLGPGELEALQAQVTADAAPLFVIAMNWIARQQIAQLGITAGSFDAAVTRIRAELSHGTPA